MKRKTTRLLVILALVFMLILPSFSVAATEPYPDYPDEIYDSVADMLAEPLTVGHVVQTMGFYELGDGGGAVYDIVASGVADGYFSFEAANHTIAKLHVFNDEVNIRQVGARGDGETDDTIAINKATLSEYGTVYAPEGTYIVTPKPHPKSPARKVAIVLGDRMVNGERKEGKNLYGDGWDKTIFKVADYVVGTAIDPNDKEKPGNYDTVIAGFNPYLKDVVLKHFTIDQNVQNNPTISVEGNIIDNAHYKKLYCIKSTLDNTIIENIRFKYQGGNAIYAADSGGEVGVTKGRGEGYIIRNCEFEFDMNAQTNMNYDNSCMYCVGSNFKVHDNKITTKLDFNMEVDDIRGKDEEGNGGYRSQIYGTGGIEIHGGGAEVYNNKIDKYYIGIHYRARAPYQHLGSKVYNNEITNAQVGFDFGPDIETPTLSNANCYNNYIHISFAYKRGFRNADPQPCGFRSESTIAFDNVQITNNHIEYDLSTLIPDHTYHFRYHGGIMIRGSHAESFRIASNIIENPPGWGIEINRDRTTLVTKDYVVENNQFINCGWSDDFKADSLAERMGFRAAIVMKPEGTLGEVSNVVVRNNSISDTTADGKCLYSISVPRSIVRDGHAIIENNTETSTSGKGFYIPKFVELTNQFYQKFPDVRTVDAFPMDGTFYKGQKVQVKDGDEVVSTWFIKKSGVIGKEIPVGNEKGTITSDISIEMDNADHGIQSGDIINIRTADGQEKFEIWVNAVTGKILYTESLNFTEAAGKVTVSYYPAAYIQDNSEVVISAVPEKPSVIANEGFYVTVKTHKQVESIRVVNESGLSIGIEEKSSFLLGDYKIWAVKIALGTAGANRVLKVYGTFDNINYDGFANLEVEVVAGTPPSSGLRAVISAIPEVTEVFQNEYFYVTVVTHKDVLNVKATNESGSTINIAEKSSVLSGSHKIWRIKIRIGTAGANRVLKVYGTFDQVNDDNYAEFTVTVNTGEPQPGDTIISATAPATAPVNTAFDVTVVTTQDIAFVKIVNETGNPLGILSSSNVISGDTKIWTISIKVGSKGSRILTALGAGADGGYSTEGKSFDIAIV